MVTYYIVRQEVKKSWANSRVVGTRKVAESVGSGDNWIAKVIKSGESGVTSMFLCSETYKKN